MTIDAKSETRVASIEYVIPPLESDADSPTDINSDDHEHQRSNSRRSVNAPKQHAQDACRRFSSNTGDISVLDQES